MSKITFSLKKICCLLHTFEFNCFLLQEGDLVSAEVQQLYSDGAASVHTRSLKYGKLSQVRILIYFTYLFVICGRGL